MLEIEAKYRLLVAPEEIEKILEEKGFRLVEEIIETDTYYNHPCRNFAETDEALRLRIRKTKNRIQYRLTYKGPRREPSSVIKTREEIEIQITDPEKVDLILDRLGFYKVSSFTKHRRVYRCNDREVEVTIDHLFGVGYFIEIEGEKGTIEKLASLLEPYVEKELQTYLEICLETKRCKTEIE